MSHIYVTVLRGSVILLSLFYSLLLSIFNATRLERCIDVKFTKKLKLDVHPMSLLRSAYTDSA